MIIAHFAFSEQKEMDRMEKFLHKTFEQTKDIARGVSEEMQKTLEQTKGLTKDFLEKFNLSASQFLGKTVEIEGKRLRIKELVGEGGFGFVFLCQEFTTNEQYIMKRVYAQDPQSMESVETEIHILETLPRHENVVHYFGTQKVSLGRNAYEYTILLEFCSGGSLFDLVNSWTRNPQKPSESQITTYFKELENVLLDQTGTCKLIDFGSCTSRAKVYETRHEMENEEEIIQKTTTLIYRAPEMVDLYRKQLINEKVDVWALGCILYTMAYLKHPFQNGTNLQILNANIAIPESPAYSPKFVSVLKSMFTPNPTERPSVSQILAQLDDTSFTPFAAPQKTPTHSRTPSNTAEPKRTHSRTPSSSSEVRSGHSRNASTSNEQSSHTPTTQQTQIKKAAPVDLLTDFDSQFASLSTASPAAFPASSPSPSPSPSTATNTVKPTSTTQSWDPFATTFSNTTQTTPSKAPATSIASFDPFSPSTTFAPTPTQTPALSSDPFGSTDFFSASKPSAAQTQAPSASFNASWAADFAVLSPQPTATNPPFQAGNTIQSAPQATQGSGFQSGFASAPAQNQWAMPQQQNTYTTLQRPQQLPYNSGSQQFQQRAVYSGSGSGSSQSAQGFTGIQSPAPNAQNPNAARPVISSTSSSTSTSASASATMTTPKKAASPFDLLDPFGTKTSASQGANTGAGAANASFASLGADDLSFFEK